MGIFDWLFKRKKLKKEYYSNGVLNIEYEEVDGKKNGLYFEYYRNGKLQIETTFKDDKMDGVCKCYYENGNLIELSFFKMGEPRLGSIWERYFENGELKEKVCIKPDPDNPYEFSEILIYKKRDEEEVRVFKEYYENGALSFELELIDGKKDGYYKDYYLSGALKIEASYKDDLLDGKCKFYYENGNLNEESHYKNGKPTGVWSWYMENGEFIRKKWVDDFDIIETEEGEIIFGSNDKKNILKTTMKQNMLPERAFSLSDGSKLGNEKSLKQKGAKSIKKKGVKSLNFKLDISGYPESTIKDLNELDRQKRKELPKITIFVDKDGHFDETKGQAKTLIKGIEFFSKIKGIEVDELVFDLATFLRMGDEFPPLTDKDGKWYVKFGNMILKSFSEKKFKPALIDLLKANNIYETSGIISINKSNGTVLEIYEARGFNIQFIIGKLKSNSEAIKYILSLIEGAADQVKGEIINISKLKEPTLIQKLYDPPENKNISKIIQIVNKKQLNKQSISYLYIEGKGLYNL